MFENAYTKLSKDKKEQINFTCIGLENDVFLKKNLWYDYFCGYKSHLEWES